MFTENAALALLAQVKANHATLGECTNHVFIRLDDRPLNPHWRCEYCGGTVDSHAKYWYELGRKHGSEKPTPA